MTKQEGPAGRATGRTRLGSTSPKRAKRFKAEIATVCAATMRPLKAVGGSYKVDRHARLLFPKEKADFATAVEATRREVNRAAQVAIARTRYERHELRAAREWAQRLGYLLTLVERAAKRLPPGDAAVVAADMAAGFAHPDASSVIGLLVPTIECINAMCALAIVLRRFDIAPPPPPRSDPLARYFVEAMAAAYKAMHALQPPRSRKGPFVDLLAAAWLDLDFPWPSPDTSLEGWLGQKAEALPTLATKVSDQTR